MHRSTSLLCLLVGASCSVQGQDAPVKSDSAKAQVIHVEGRCVHPINLATALQLAQVRSIDIQVATERVAAADARLSLARSRWLPTVLIGGDYARHDGQIQDIVGTVFPTTRSSVMVGVGPSMVFSPSDAILAPLAARQVVNSRAEDFRAAQNDTMLTVAETYFALQRARGELAGALEAERLAADLVHRAEKLAAGLAQPVEANRAKTELSRRRQAVEAAHERAEIAIADLNRLLRLPPNTLVEPIEPPQVRVDLFDTMSAVDDMILIGLTNRPELASQQALVAATVARLRQEKLRPLVPSVILRGNATNPGGSLASGQFAGGVNSEIGNAGWRNSYDVQVLWELQGLGLGNRALVREREAENRTAMLELFRVQDRVAAEVVQAHAQATRAANRATLAEEGLKDATETVKTNLEGLSQTRRVGETLVLVFRPQEVVAAVQALDQAYRDHFTAVADANRAQFRLYRALGHPAACVLAKKAVEELPAPAARLVAPPSNSHSVEVNTAPLDDSIPFDATRRSEYVPVKAADRRPVVPAAHVSPAQPARKASKFATDRRP
jgi:outer membrane protein TolC